MKVLIINPDDYSIVESSYLYPTIHKIVGADFCVDSINNTEFSIAFSDCDEGKINRLVSQLMGYPIIGTVVIFKDD